MKITVAAFAFALNDVKLNAHSTVYKVVQHTLWYTWNMDNSGDKGDEKNDGFTQKKTQ